jgi:hypothetical protein
MSGGTDGAAGVTDATLVGQDIVPRKGMYALRTSNVDCFTLCDLSNISTYAAIASFALSETMLAVQASAVRGHHRQRAADPDQRRHRHAVVQV